MFTFTDVHPASRNPEESFVFLLGTRARSVACQPSHTLDHPGLNCSNLFCLEVLELDDAAAALVAAAALSARALSCSCEVPRKSVGTCRKFVLTCFDYFVHILLCVPLHANQCPCFGWLELISRKEWPNEMATPVAPPPSSAPLPVFPRAFAAVHSRRQLRRHRKLFLYLLNCLLLLALCIPPQQAGLGNQGPGKPGPSMMLSDMN